MHDASIVWVMMHESSNHYKLTQFSFLQWCLWNQWASYDFFAAPSNLIQCLRGELSWGYTHYLISFMATCSFHPCHCHTDPPLTSPCRSPNKLQLSVPLAQTNSLKHSFSSSVSTFWNNLSFDLTSMTFLLTFKKSNLAALTWFAHLFSSFSSFFFI